MSSQSSEPAPAQTAPDNVEVIVSDDNGNFTGLVNPEPFKNVGSTQNQDSSENAPPFDLVEMVDAGQPQPRVFNVYYPWDSSAEEERNSAGYIAP